MTTSKLSISSILLPLPSLEALEGPKVFKITLQSTSYKTMQTIKCKHKKTK